MDGIPPSICPTGIYRPPQHSPTSVYTPMRLLQRQKDGRGIVSWLSTLVRKTVCAFDRRNQEAGR